MKRKLHLFKTLLVAALLGAGSMSAWADVPTYTWDFTNTTTWTTAKVSTGSAVTLNPSGATPGTGEYGVTFNFATNVTTLPNSGGVVGTYSISNTESYTILWWNTTNTEASESANNVSISVPSGFKVTFTLQCTGSRPMGYKIGSNASATTDQASLVYTNETDDPVTITVWGTNSVNSARRQNGIHRIVLEDFSAVASHTWSAKAYATINEVKTEIDSWDAAGAKYSESETYNVWAKKVISYSGHYYELDDAKFAANSVYFNTTMGDADADYEITYTLNDNIAFYTEGEAWDTNSQLTSSLVASAGQYVYFYAGTQDVDITDAGVYRMETNVLSRGSDSGLRVYDDADNELAGFYRTGTGFKQTDAFYTAASSTIKVGMASANTAGIDYVLIRKITEASDAIAYCKLCETSSDFATHIDGLYAAGSLLTAAQVYAAYNAWEVAQVEASSSTDYTKVILNADFGTNNLTPWTIYGDASAATTDADKYGTLESNGNGGYQYYTGWNGRNVSQTIAGLPAGNYRLTARIYSWSEGAPVRIFANGVLSESENGEDHLIGIDFNVTGSETSVKIGVGGIGNNNDTDNTWGTWGYRIDYFTLTKLPESVSKEISSAGWSTYCSPYILDFSSAIANLDAAYIVTGGAAGVLTKTPVTGAVPAGTGLLLKGTASAEVAIPVAATAGFDVTDNKLVGVTASETLTANSGYVLMTSPSLAFYKNNKDFTLSANSAYLPADFDGSSAPVFLLFSGSETTGINAVQGSQSKANGDYYNLNGQRVAQPTKGLYIVNGKKVVVK